MQIASSCLANVTPFHFWSLADHFPDLVSRLHVQVRLMGQFGLSGSIPWLCDSDGAFCFVCKQDIESVTHFLLDCTYFKQNFPSLWRNICHFIDNLLLLLRGFCLSFDNVTNTLIKRFIGAAVGKTHKLRRERLRELEAQSLTKK